MKRKLVSFYMNLKLSQKMMILYTLSAVILCAVALFSLRVSFNIYDGQLYEKSLQELDFFSQKIDGTLDDISQLTQRLALNLDVQDELSTIALLDYPSNAYSYRILNLNTLISNEIKVLNTLAANEMTVYPAAKNISFIDKNRIQLTLGKYSGEIDPDVYRELLRLFAQANGEFVYLSPSQAYPYLLSGRSIIRPSLPEDTSDAKPATEQLGAFMVVTDLNSVVEDYSKTLEAEHAALYIYSGSELIYSEADAPFAASPDTLPDSSGYKIITDHGERYFMCYLRSARTAWTYINIFPYSEVFHKTEAIRNILIIAYIVIFLLLVLVLHRISSTITKPLQQLTQSMSLVEVGKFQSAKEVSKLITRRDEVGQLAHEYQTMLDKIDDLMYENYQKQLMLKETKYQFLQAQINPHFLNNALNTLNWLVRANRNDDAGKMIVSLGHLMRNSFGKNYTTSVAEEVQLAKSYITIQQYRYQKRADFAVEVYGALEKYQMPSMVLQPLIENALLHGVDNSPNFCHVTVRAIEQADTILLEVRDTGAGLSAEALEQARSLTIVPKGHGIGLKNIHERLHIVFPSFTFQIDSTPGRGTSIRILIPRKEVSHVQVTDR